MVAEGISDGERAILEARTRALAARPPERITRERLNVVTVTASGERYAIEASVVHAVLAVQRITPLPHAPPHVAGLVVHAGNVLPAFHLGAVLELPLAALPEHGQVVLVGHRSIELALVVDQVGGMTRLDAASLSEPPAGLGSTVRALLRGVDPQGLPVLDGRKLLQAERLVVDIPIPSRARGEEDARPDRGER